MMAIRGPTGKFFYDREHDVYMYYLILEAYIFDEARGDHVFTCKGNIKMRGGWKAIAAEMSRVFQREFTATQMRDRFFRFTDKYFDVIFDEVSDLRDKMEMIQEVMDS